jgi:hypothetical protein
MAKQIDLEQWLKELQADVDKKQLMIAEIKEKLGQRHKTDEVSQETDEITLQQSENDVGTTETVHIRSDAFFQMSMPRAAEKYLKMIKRPAHTNEISEALKKGGFLSQAKNFNVVVHSGLHRDKAFIKVGKDWGLAEWYPARTKSTEIGKASKPKGKPKKTKKPKRDED